MKDSSGVFEEAMGDGCSPLAQNCLISRFFSY